MRLLRLGRPLPTGNGKSHKRWKATRMASLTFNNRFQRSLSGQGGGQAGGASGTVCTDLSGFTVCESGAGRGRDVLSAGAEYPKDAGSGERTPGKGSEQSGNVAAAFRLLLRQDRSTRESRNVREKISFVAGCGAEAGRSG